MSNKAFAQVSVLALFLLTFLGTPPSVQAGGVCGGAYVVEQGETVESIAAKCGTKASAIYAANPGISGNLYAGQVLTVPGSNYISPSNNTYYNYASVNYNGTYIVQYGDTFSAIASRFGVSMYDLWAANPYIWDINILYVGQVIHVPGSAWIAIVPTPAKTPVPLSYGTVPKGTPNGAIQLANKANSEVYVSLQGTTRDGIHVIREYPISRAIDVEVPAGWYIYVAWVGGQKFEGQFNLGGGSDHSITFYSNKVIVE